MTPAQTATETDIHEIRGPAALEGGWQRFRDLLWLTAVAEFKHRYAGSRFGYVWAVLQPILVFGVLYIFVTEILGSFAGQLEHYPVLLLLNIELFQFFQDSAIYSTYSLERSALVRKVRLPQVILPLSSVLTTGFSLAIGLSLAMLFILADGITPMWSWLLFPLVILMLVVFSSAVALLAASLYVRNRDVAQIIPVSTRVLFFLSPVVFPIEILPKGWLTTLESLNPLAPIFVQARVWLIDPDAPSWFEFADSTFMALLPFAMFLAICILGWTVFSRRAQRLAEEL